MLLPVTYIVPLFSYIIFFFFLSFFLNISLTICNLIYFFFCLLYIRVTLISQKCALIICIYIYMYKCTTTLITFHLFLYIKSHSRFYTLYMILVSFDTSRLDPVFQKFTKMSKKD